MINVDYNVIIVKVMDILKNYLESLEPNVGDINKDMKSIVYLFYENHTTGRVVSDNFDWVDACCSYFSRYAENFKYDKRYKHGAWDGKIKFVHKDGRFGIGLINYIYKYFKEMDITVHVDKRFNEHINAKNDIDDTLNFIDKNNTLKDWEGVRPYQRVGALKALHFKRGILLHETASGKSLTMAIICHYLISKKIKDKILIIVPTTGLVRQMKGDFIEYGINPEWIGEWFGDIKDEDKHITIGTWQSMYVNKPNSHAKRKPKPEIDRTKVQFLRQFGAILLDECQGAKSDCIRFVSEYSINADIRIGLTGTLPDVETQRYLIFSTLGSIIDTVDYQKLVKGGWITPATIRMICVDYPQKMLDKLPKSHDYKLETKFLWTNPIRNSVICKICEAHMKKGENVLILTDQKKNHADFIIKTLEKNINPDKIYYLHGKVALEEKDYIRKLVNEKSGIVIVAISKLFSTGSNIKKLHAVILASAGKSKIKILQSIGRLLRLHITKNRAHVYDIIDRNLKYAERHAEDRMKYYAEKEYDLQFKDLDYTKHDSLFG